jgi:hypothetical protein
MTESNKGIVIPTDVYDSEGNMTKIEFHNKSGEFVIEAVWDPKDPQDSEHRILFRKWAYRMLDQLGYQILK